LKKACRIREGKVKLPGHRPGLPGKVIAFHIVPLDPAYKAGLAWHVPVNVFNPRGLSLILLLITHIEQEPERFIQRF
jgi:hypothetical protein